MKEIFSFIFDIITDPFTLPVEPLYEWVILGVLGVIAYLTSYRIVGDMYDRGSISGSFLGSLFHWIIRLFIFVMIWFVAYWAIVIVQWITDHRVLAMSILGILTVLSVATICVIHFSNSRS